MLKCTPLFLPPPLRRPANIHCSFSWYSKQTFCNNSKFSVPEKHRILSTAQLQSNTGVKWHHKHSWTPPVWLSSTLCFPSPPHSSKWVGSTSWITAGITPGLSSALTLEARAALNPLSWLIFDNVLTIMDDFPLGFSHVNKNHYTNTFLDREWITKAGLY